MQQGFIFSFIKETIHRCKVKISKLHKKYDLEKDINKLKEKDSKELTFLKYSYIKEGKEYRNSGNALKNLSLIVTITITLVSATSPILVQFTDNILKEVDNAFNNSIEIISKEKIPADKKIQKIKEQYTKLYTGKQNKNIFRKEIYERIVNGVCNMAIGCIVLSAIIIFGSRSYHRKAAHYETLVQYIDTELIKE